MYKKRDLPFINLSIINYQKGTTTREGIYYLKRVMYRNLYISVFAHHAI